jgi:TRAP transporter TAXI family solute receptor
MSRSFVRPPSRPGLFRLRYSHQALALFLVLLAALWLLLAHAMPAPPKQVGIATAFKGGAYEHFGQRYQQALQAEHIRSTLLPSQGSVENLRLLADPGSGVHLAFVQGGVSNAQRSPGLVSLGRINHQILWIFHRAEVPFDTLTQLKQRRLAVGPQDSGTRVLADQVLKLHGISAGNAQLLPLAGEAAAEALLSGQVDAIFMAFAADSPLVQRLLHDPRVQLLSLRQAEAITRHLSFLVRLVLPQGAIDLEHNKPMRDIELLATTNAVLVREELHPDLVQLLTRHLVAEHGQAGLFQRAGEFPLSSDPEYPMAPAALRYYKQGPSFLQRLLPLSMAVQVERLAALLLSAAALFFPIFNYAPRLYRWWIRERLHLPYRQLRALEARLQHRLDADEKADLLRELDALSDKVRQLGVPSRHSDLFFELQSDIQLVLMRLRESPAGDPGTRERQAETQTLAA